MNRANSICVRANKGVLFDSMIEDDKKGDSVLQNELATYVRQQAFTIWASAKMMHFMTESQIRHYQLDCKRLKFHMTGLKSENVKETLEKFLKPF